MPLISRREVAEHLDLTPQAVSLLAKRPDCPKRADRFQWPAFNVWYWTVVKAPKATSYEDARARREAALAAQEEIKLLALERRVDYVEVYERRYAEALGRVVAKLKALPNRLAPAVVGARDIPDGLSRVTPLVDEVVAELARAEDAPGGGDDTDDEEAA